MPNATGPETGVCVFGLGEAGSLIAADLADAGLAVHGYDPKPVTTPAGVRRYDDPVAAVAEVDLVIALTAAADAVSALEQARDSIPRHALYADFSTAAADLKRDLAQRCERRGIDFADVAIMSIVPGNGVRAPTLVSGSGARRFVDIFTVLGMPTSMVSEQAGDAASRKLVRSVMMKGLAAVVIEAMQAAEAAGCVDWLWQNLSVEITAADEKLLSRLVRGTHRHGLRRLHEMEAATELLRALEIEPLMTAATAENLRRVVEDWPDPVTGDSGGKQRLPGWWDRI